jgi:23S rRNA (uracil1939-C5)-methyltransferase
MKQRRSRNRLKEDVLLLDMAAEGKCVARIEDKVYFVEGGVPGDLVDLLVEKDKKTYGEGRVYRLKKPSPDRQDAFCSHFGVCGGCKWQNLSYARQLELKTKQVKDAFERIGKCTEGEWNPILGSAETTYYRNKLEFTFSHLRWLEQADMGSESVSNPEALGFHIPKRFDKILDIEHCHLQADPSNAVRLWVKAYALEKNLSFFDLREQKGFLRNLMIRNTAAGEWLVLLIVAEDRPDETVALLSDLRQAFPSLTSLQYVLNQKRNDSYSDLKPVSVFGPGYVLEQMENLSFRVGPTSFYQTNGPQALNLYRLVDRLANCQPEDLVYDLYTGTGTIALFLARKAKFVVGIEYVEAAVEDARSNSELNHLGNTAFFSGDMARVLNDSFVEIHGKPDIIVTDPPRAGMHPDVVQAILKIGARKVVYVSCNPATQARDLHLLQIGYHVREIHPVDMFPHTHHVENVVLLERRSEIL